MIHILNVEDARILFIASDAFGRDVLSCFHELPQINFIYILIETNENEEQWIESMRKIRKVTSNIEDVYEQIRRDVRRTEHDLIHLNIIGKTIQGHNNKQEASFMYAQLLKETLLQTTDGDEQEIVQFSRRQYEGNPTELAFIDELEQTYRQHSPVWWYTRQSFLYKILNKALRDQHAETLYVLHYFIRQLHEQLRALRRNHIEHKTMKLYRGQAMPNAQFNTLKANVGGLLSVSNFLSTTFDINVAMMFTGDDDERTGVLMVIDIDLSMEGDALYADIDSISYFAGHEKKWLFSMGSVFRINSVKRNEQNIWIAHLTLTNDQDPQLMQLTSHLRNTIRDPNALYQLGRLMLEMNEKERAEQFYRVTLQTVTEWKQRAAILHQLGTLHDVRDELDQALDYFMSSLRIYLEHVPDDHPLLACTYNSIGSIYSRQNKHDLGLEYLHRALNIGLAASEPNQETIARTYNNIAVALSEQEKHTESIAYNQRTLDIKLKTLPLLILRLPSLIVILLTVFFV